MINVGGTTKEWNCSTQALFALEQSVAKTNDNIFAGLFQFYLTTDQPPTKLSNMSHTF